MDREVLVDTSVWIRYFKDGSSREAKALDSLLAGGLVVTCGPVKAEIFSGVRSKDELQKLKRFFSALTDVPVPSDAWERIGELRSGLAARGIQASLVDLWIGLAASENGVLLWTLDKDFQHIARIVSLEMFEG